ncbi:hypothetical protein KFK09_019153 [Dendrobium nobile]|uniref:Uncharacterized protein n=1 Tax=Dendrobium nobile TaxID=94219 RepID=A0A8T3B368_DENNO|nr:hypothetical protein KFK09_019153 [Dendrobium nobile]
MLTPADVEVETEFSVRTLNLRAKNPPIYQPELLLRLTYRTNSGKADEFYNLHGIAFSVAVASYSEDSWRRSRDLPLSAREPQGLSALLLFCCDEEVERTE